MAQEEGPDFGGMPVVTRDGVELLEEIEAYLIECSPPPPEPPLLRRLGRAILQGVSAPSPYMFMAGQWPRIRR